MDRHGPVAPLPLAALWCQTDAMDIGEWWPRLDPAAREWLTENNGDAVRPDVLAQITAVAGPAAGASWAGDDGEGGFALSDDAVDWVEAAANGESPQDGR